MIKLGIIVTDRLDGRAAKWLPNRWNPVIAPHQSALRR